MKPRSDFGAKADKYFSSLNDSNAALARALRALVRRAIPNASESIKWGSPVYETDKLVCAIRPSKNYIALQFYSSGTSLPDPKRLLEGTGKRMRHVKIRAKADIKKKLFTTWIRKAAA